MKKPEPESYQLTLRLLQIAPQETIFVDGDQSYVTAAQALGYPVSHYSANHYRHP